MAPDEVPAFVDDNWPWLASPIAYDLSLQVQPSEGLSVSNAYGFPGESTEIEVATVFLSKKKGALLLELEPSVAGALDAAAANVRLTYQTRDGEALDLPLSASYAGQPLDERGSFMPQLGIDKAVALALLVEGMREAAELYAADKTEAIRHLEATLSRFDSDATAIADEAIDAEASFWPKLLDLMQSGAPQGSMYGT